MNLSLPRQRLLGTGVLSASALLLEIALTRLFSVLYFPPYVYFIISVSILGIGIGAALPALRPALASGSHLTRYCAGRGSVHIPACRSGYPGSRVPYSASAVCAAGADLCLLRADDF